MVSLRNKELYVRVWVDVTKLVYGWYSDNVASRGRSLFEIWRVFVTRRLFETRSTLSEHRPQNPQRLLESRRLVEILG